MAGSSFATELDYIRGLVNSSSPQCTRFFSKAFSLFKACLKRRLIVSDDPEITALQYLGLRVELRNKNHQRYDQST
jgi:hypothetical protein